MSCSVQKIKAVYSKKERKENRNVYKLMPHFISENKKASTEITP